MQVQSEVTGYPERQIQRFSPNLHSSSAPQHYLNDGIIFVAGLLEHLQRTLKDSLDA